jgi:hypothetical protein
MAVKIEWIESASCAGAPEDFYTESARKALHLVTTYCDVCPVKADCLDFALSIGDFEPTIYGGLTGAERKAYDNVH